MPILVLPVILALTSVSLDRDIAAADLAPAAVAGRSDAAAESPTFDPKQPPRWWLNKMQRPCAPSGARVSC